LEELTFLATFPRILLLPERVFIQGGAHDDAGNSSKRVNFLLPSQDENSEVLTLVVNIGRYSGILHIGRPIISRDVREAFRGS
jgi:hypothetical protein